MLNKGIVIQAVKDNFLVFIQGEIINCAASQKVKLKNKIVCGDKVEVDFDNKYITDVFDRKNLITRPKVANVDKVFITTSFKEPDLATLLVDKMILFYSFFNVEPILVFTKADLKQEDEYQKIIDEYKSCGYKISEVSIDSVDKEFFINEIKNSTSIFAGQSGVGKSTILNQLSDSLDITTNEISKVLNRGKHTTTKNTLYRLFDGLICDTPGFSSVEQIALKPAELSNQFLDFRKYAANCKFHNCIHVNETVCGVKEQVDKKISKTRYNNYVNILKKLKGEK